MRYDGGMLDSRLRPLFDPVLMRFGRWLAQRGATADSLSIAGCMAGLAAAVAVTMGAHILALVLFAVGRVVDGLDGAVARATTATDRGGYLDIVLDFAVYAALPLAFAVHAPEVNALPAATLLAAIVLNGSAFLAFAIMAEKRKLSTSMQGEKSLFYLAGLAEGTETIAIYALMCILPGWFPILAYGFAMLCLLSALGRISLAWRRLR
jgi:phosphatidylglycerophosphate synthase